MLEMPCYRCRRKQKTPRKGSCRKRAFPELVSSASDFNLHPGFIGRSRLKIQTGRTLREQCEQCDISADGTYCAVM